MAEGQPVAREAIPPCPWEHSPGQCCGRRWHRPRVPLSPRLPGILLWVNPTAPDAFLQRGPVQELTKASPSVLGGSEHLNIGARGCPNPELCPEIFLWLRGIRHGAHLRRDNPSQPVFPGVPIPSLCSALSPTSPFLKRGTHNGVWDCFGLTGAEPGRG